MGREDGRAKAKGGDCISAQLSPREWQDVQLIREHLTTLGVSTGLASRSKAVRYALRLVAGMIRRKMEKEVKHEQA